MKKSLFLYTFFPLLSFFIVSIGLIQNDNSIYAFSIILIFTTIFFKHVLTLNVESKIFYIFFIGFLLRLCLIFIDVNIYEIDPGDSKAFRQGAEDFFYTGRTLFKGRQDSSGTILFMGIIDTIFGPHRVIIQYFNTLFFMTATYFTYKMLSDFSVPSKLKFILILWMIFSPQNVKNTAISNREGFISLFVALSVYSFSIFVKYRSLKYVVMSFASVFIGCLLHSGIISLLGGYIFYLVVYNPRKNKYEFTTQSITYFVVTFASLAVCLLLFGDSILSKFGNVDSTNDITKHVESFDDGGSNYEVPFGTSILATPLRAIYFLLSPMPWYWRNPIDIIAFIVCGFPHIIICVLYYKYAKYMDQRQKIIFLALIISAICISVVFGWGCKNAGTAIRHRDKFLSLYAVILGLIINVRNQKLCTNR